MDKKKGRSDRGREAERDPVELVEKAMEEPVPEETDNRLRASLAEFREELKDHPYVRKLDRARQRKGRFGPHHSLRRRLALTGAGAVLILVVFLVLPFGNGTPTWAEVSQRFQSVRFFKITFYGRDDLLDEPWQLEYWRGKGGQSRARSGSQVAFGEGGTVTRAFDVVKRTETAPDGNIAAIIRGVGSETRFSLDTLFAAFSPGYEMTETTATVNADPTISHDLVVYDLTKGGWNQWYRVWALKESRLPVRLLCVNPETGSVWDAFFTYTKDQPVEFFDPGVFARKQADPSLITEDLIFDDIRDPVGDPPTSSQNTTKEKETPATEKTEVQMPVVQRAGVDVDGAVWVLAETDNKNRFRFREVWRMEDQSGREYHMEHASTTYPPNSSTAEWHFVFLSEGYPFDTGRPESVVLLLDSITVGKPRWTVENVGEVPIDNLEAGVPPPWGGDRESRLIAQARWLEGWRRYEEAERVLESIAGKEEELEAAFRKDQVRLSILAKRGTDWEEAVKLGARLQPILEQQYATFDRKYRLRGTRLSSFEDYTKALLKTDRMDEAATVVQRILKIPVPQIPHDLGLSSRQRKQARERMIRHDATEMPTFAYNIFAAGGMRLEEMNVLFGTNVLEDERFSEMAGTFINLDKQRRESAERAEQRRETLEYFESHPWPEEAVLIPAKKAKPGMNYSDGPVPGKPAYGCECMIGEPFETLGDYFRRGRRYGAGRIRMADEFRDIELEHCLVYRDGVPKRKRDEALLDFFGLEVVEVTEPRAVWIASHDGRTLSPYTEVKAPYPYDDKRADKTGTARSGSPMPYTLSWLSDDFVSDQDPSLSAEGILIVDETAIESGGDGSEEGKPVFVSCESPWWTGEDGPEMAREWFEKELGVTFREEVRPVTVYVVRRKGTDSDE